MGLLDYILLVSATAAGVGAGLGGIMLTLTPSHLRAAKAAFWFAAICFGGLGIVWGVHAANYPLSIRLGVAGLTAASAAMALVYLLSVLDDRQSASPLAEQSLPGFSTTLGIKIRDAAAIRRQYLFEYQDDEGASIRLNLSRSADRFTFSVTDTGNDSHSLEIPIGKSGIPIYGFIFLTAEVGLANNATYLRVLVNGKDVKNAALPFRVDLGSRHWKQGNIGADIKGENNSAFEIAAASMGHVTLTDQNISDLIGRLREYLTSVKFNFK